MYIDGLERMNPYEAIVLKPVPEHPAKRQPGRFRLWLFEVRWMWRNRSWKPTRQKHKQFERDYKKFEQCGVTPW